MHLMRVREIKGDQVICENDWNDEHLAYYADNLLKYAAAINGKPVRLDHSFQFGDQIQMPHGVEPCMPPDTLLTPDVDHQDWVTPEGNLVGVQTMIVLDKPQRIAFWPWVYGATNE